MKNARTVAALAVGFAVLYGFTLFVIITDASWRTSALIVVALVSIPLLIRIHPEGAEPP